MHMRLSRGLVFLIAALAVSCSSSTDSDDGLAQWATSAVASSEYPDYGPGRATGAPDVTASEISACTDVTKVWASSATNTEEWLELTYAQAVRPTRIRIHEFWSLGQITRVEVKHADGTYHTVYSAQPSQATKVVRISVDQRARDDWQEIDAVQLIGIP
jgi:hypothetical protein